MEIVLRPATLADAPAVAKLSGHFGHPATADDMGHRLQLLMESDRDWAWVAEEAGQVVGWIQASRMLRLERGEFMEITGLVVDESLRSQGIGERLVRHAQAFAAEEGYTRLVVRSNVVRERAHGFYLRLGFTLLKQQCVFDLGLR